MQIVIDPEVYEVLGEVRFEFLMAPFDDIQASSDEFIQKIEQAAEALVRGHSNYSHIFSDYCEVQGLSPKKVWNPLKQARLIAANGYRSHGKVIDAYMLSEMKTGISIHAFDAEDLDSLELKISDETYLVKNVSGRQKQVREGEWILVSDDSVIIAASVGVTYPYRITDHTQMVCYRLMKLAGQPDDLVNEAKSQFLNKVDDVHLIELAAI